MSALAARRAAQAAQANAGSSRPAVKSNEPAIVVSSSKTPSMPSSDEESNPEAGPSKRRRTTQKAKPARYFAPVEDEDDDDAGLPARVKKAKSSRERTRRFSPSAPASDAEKDSSDEGEDESSAELAVDEGRFAWTASTTIPTRPGASAAALAPVTSSKFKAVSGSNFCLLTEEGLNGSGLVGQGAGVVISLGKQDSIMLAGLYTILPLQSPLAINSTAIYPWSGKQSFPVFAPSSHPIPIIAGTSMSRRTQPSPLLSKLPLPSTFQIGEARTIFLVREYGCGLTGLKNGVVPGFANIWGEDKGIWGLRSIHPILGNTPTIYYPHVHPESWTAPLASLAASEANDNGQTDFDDEDESEPLVALVKGPKRSGKSTFARAVLNNLLNRYNRVAWLECDLGQGEFSPGGAVGIWIIDSPILGPPFTHPRIPERAHYLGSFSPQSCPDEYIASIQQLINHYTYEIANPLLSTTFSSESGGQSKISSVVPLVINTQGWVKGLGEELLHAIEASLAPTHIFSFEMDIIDETAHVHGNGNGWTSSPPPEIPYHLANPSYTYGRVPIIHTLTSAPISPLLARHTPSDLRTLSMMAYFHSTLSSNTPTWDFTAPLLAVPPCRVHLSPTGQLRRVIMSGEGSEAISPSDLGLALSGNIVALVEMNELDPNGPIYDPEVPPPSLEETTYLGLALVQGLRQMPVNEDQTQGFTLDLLTPLPEAVLARANCIIRNGAVELPLCGMLDWRSPNAQDLASVKWEDVPYLDVSGVVGVGGERRRFRRNLMRKGQ